MSQISTLTSDPKFQRAWYLSIADVVRQAVSKGDIKPMKSGVIGVASFVSQATIGNAVSAAFSGLVSSTELSYIIQLLSEAVSTALVLLGFEMVGVISKSNAEADPNAAGGTRSKGKFGKAFMLATADVIIAEVMRSLFGGMTTGNVVAESQPVIGSTPSYSQQK